MKKFLVLMLTVTLVMTASLFTGCKNVPDKNVTDNTDANKGTQTETGNKDIAVRTGYAVVSSAAKSKDAAEAAEGLAQVDSNVVALMLDAKGKILKCVIDSVQTKINFDATGKITTGLDTTFKSKNELGEAYGLKKASGIGKEWNEQAAALAKYVVGKTVDEVKAIAIDKDTKPTGGDLTSSVTITIGGYIDAIEKAAANAKESGAKASDKLGIGIVTNIAKSTSAAAANGKATDGKAQAYSNYAVITTGADGKITSCVIDASQSDVTFNDKGVITSDKNAQLKTKDQLADAYGMKKSSGIGKEWYEQANAFASYVIGKTVNDVKGIAVDKDTHATGADLKASVTITIGEFQNAIEKAAASAK